VALSLQLLGLPFSHRSLSVFSTFAQFQEINPVVKAPSLVCDDGMVQMDSTLILEWAEALAAFMAAPHGARTYQPVPTSPQLRPQKASRLWTVFYRSTKKIH
jgi:glutathione S-transferase